MKIFIAVLGLLSIAGSDASAGPADQIAGNAASIIGAAPACGIAPARIGRTDRAMRQDIADRSTDPADKAKALEMYESGLKRAAENQAGPNKEDCTDVVNAFGTIEGAANSLRFMMPR